MVCIYCDNKTKVTNSRASAKTKTTWRRRQCHSCRSIFTTREQIETAGTVRVKTSTGHLQPFLRDKLFLSLHRSLLHRKTAVSDASALTDTVLHQLNHLQTNGVLQNTKIIETTAKTLKRFDKAAHTSYLAFYS